MDAEHSLTRLGSSELWAAASCSPAASAEGLSALDIHPEIMPETAKQRGLKHLLSYLGRRRTTVSINKSKITATQQKHPHLLAQS